MNNKLLFYFFAMVVVTSAASIPQSYDFNKAVDINSLPTPDQLVLDLTEDEYDDYLDYWLHQKYLNNIEREQRNLNYYQGCVIPIKDLKEPLPAYATFSGLLQPNGTSGNIILKASQVVDASCPGYNNGLAHYESPFNPTHINLQCESGTSITSSWIPEVIDFVDIKCLHRTNFTTFNLNSPCSGGGALIVSTVHVGNKDHSVLTSCFHEQQSEVFYVEYEQNPENIYSQPNVVRPRFYQGTHFPNLNVDQLYTQASQKISFDEILGSNMHTKYINATFFLARGHLAAKTDYVLAAAQRATFTFVNAAPQWQPFNGGNWNILEQKLRARVAEAGYRTKIYTGTWDILKLPDSSGVLKEIYLNPSTQQIPVPMWFYKVVYEPSTERSVVFLGLNNPHVTLEEARDLAFCTDICADNPDFSWLNWLATNVGRGYSICCEVDDFRRTVTVLPPFITSDILS